MAGNKNNNKKLKVLGTGSFGAVIYPSLKNNNNNEN